MGNVNEIRARRPEETCMDTINRALSELDNEPERIVIVLLNKDGDTGKLYSNARSEPEMNGMLWGALNTQTDLSEEE